MNIEKEAIKFAKNFAGELTFTELKSYVEKHIRYKLLFFDTELAQRELLRLNMKIPKSEKGLAVNGGTSKIVFLKSNLSEDEKIQCLLHEVGHIILGHLDIPSRELNREKAEHDAELFSYMVLANVKRRAKASYKISCIVLTIIVCLQSAVLGFNFFGKISEHADKESDFAIETSAFDYASGIGSVDSAAFDNSEYMVYVTAEGQKYHKLNCQYVKNKTNIRELTLKEADKKYSPCSVCNP